MWRRRGRSVGGGGGSHVVGRNGMPLSAWEFEQVFQGNGLNHDGQDSRSRLIVRVLQRSVGDTEGGPDLSLTGCRVASVSGSCGGAGRELTVGAETPDSLLQGTIWY